MSFPKYPAYKPSGVEWLGDVPAHWEIKRISHVASLLAGFAFPSDMFLFDPALGTRLVRGDNVSEGFLRWGDKGRYWPLNLSVEPRYSLAADDIVIQMDGSKVGKNWAIISNADLPALLVQRVTRIRVDQGVLPAFVYSQIASAQFSRYVDRAKTDPAIPHITMKNIGDYWITVPPLSEQQEIGNFLAKETAKIDALIAEQEKLIALLAEKRQATISHAVTRGLNHEAPMKDSGVAWIGEVPGHWRVCAMRRVIFAIEQGWSPECYAREAEVGEWGVLKAGCLNGGIFRPSENKALPPELSPDAVYEVRVGDVLMSRASGSPELVGSTAMVTATRAGLMLSDKIFRIRLQDAMTPRYFVVALNSRTLRTQIENALSGGNGMANNLPQSNLLTFSIPVPPTSEQDAIADFIDTETTRLDALRAEAERAIALLKERRSAVIAAAVTGKMDVRHLA